MNISEYNSIIAHIMSLPPADFRKVEDILEETIDNRNASMQPFEEGDWMGFKTKSAIKNHIKGIKDKYNVGETVIGSDREFMEELFMHHHEYATKIGCGLMEITVEEAEYGHTRFEIKRLDGTSATIAPDKIISRATPLAELKQALRTLVKDQVFQFKKDFFTDKYDSRRFCEVSGVPIDWNGSDVDHIPPMTFDTLVNMWIKQYNIDVDKVKWSNPSENNCVPVFRDNLIVLSFMSFHKEHANLRVISKNANRGIVKRLHNQATFHE